MPLTECCNAYDTFWDDLHVCRKCHKPNPTMVEVEEKQELTLPQLDSHDDGPIDGYDY
tara:strand:+ start:1334 stop:1507 length:174 start_codon:yes stop_codon:yes gene_type:complete